MPTATPTPSVHTGCRLFYRDGASDKEYHASIQTVDGGYLVNFAFGRRGSALSAGTKTTSPVPLQKAQALYDKLIAEKTAKGYTPSGPGALFATTEYEKRVSGLVPQLLNSIEEREARRLVEDDLWCLQEKFDGKRIMVSVEAGRVEGSNRKGLSVPMLQEVVDSLANLPDCELDGELLGGEYVVFDLLKLDRNDLRLSPYRVRQEVLMDLLSAGLGPYAHVAETAWTPLDKRALYERVVSRGGEGVVFKKGNAPYVAGRPASGGSQVKCKFYATCTCLVAGSNDQRSVRLSLQDEKGQAVPVGSVSIPPTKPMPPEGALVEVRYLYAYKGGSLYQPAYLGERDDLNVSDCLLRQLKYKAEGEEG